MVILIHFIILNTCIFPSYPYCPFICRSILPLSIDSPVISSAAPPPDVSRATETLAASSSLPPPRRSISIDGELLPADLSSHVPVPVPRTGTISERGITLMKDFYTKLFPESERFRSETRKMERGMWPRSRLLCCRRWRAGNPRRGGT